jgi:hypothetical protein
LEKEIKRHKAAHTASHQVPVPDDAPSDEFFRRRAAQIVADQSHDQALHQQAVSIHQQLSEIERQRRQAEIEDYNRQVAEYNRRQQQGGGGGGHQGGSVNYGALIQGIGNLFGGHGGGGGHHQ